MSPVGFERAALSLKGRYSTTELRAHPLPKLNKSDLIAFNTLAKEKMITVSVFKMTTYKIKKKARSNKTAGLQNEPCWF
jgi:hypothetical protein